jgi:transcriptional regulator with XRE-family HTH domain
METKIMRNNRDYMPPKRLKKLRNAMGDSQAELAKKLGVTQATISRWEDGELLIKGPVKVLLERMLQDWLVDD